MKKLILLFIALYCLLGITNSMFFGTPNNTNDFVFHYYRANGDTTNPEFTEHYSVEGMSSYPRLFHIATSFFAQNKLLFYIAMVFLICGLMPLLIYKVAGNIAVWVYFALSLPHMVLYNATFASFLILIYFVIYLKYRTFPALFFLTILAFFTHRWGALFFLAILIAELISSIIKKHELVFAPAGVLLQNKITSFTKIISVLLHHVNFYFLYLARKSKESFYWILILIGFVGAIIIDFRIITLAQISLAIMLGNLYSNKQIPKYFYVIAIILMFFNFVWFFWQTERFLF